MVVIHIAPRRLGRSAPANNFFDEVRAKALRALEVVTPNEAQAWDLCEFVDCLDAGDITHALPQREDCVQAISRFLRTANPAQFRKFYRGSFSAQGHGISSESKFAALV